MIALFLIVSALSTIWIKFCMGLYHTEKLIASDPSGQCCGDSFGSAVGIYGNYTIIGASSPTHQGAYIFKRNYINHTWIEMISLEANDMGYDDDFGSDVSIYGEYAIIGAPNNNGGRAYIFKQVNNTWLQITKLIANDGDTYLFGNKVIIQKDYVLIGTNDLFQQTVLGDRVYIFKRNDSFNSNWNLITILKPSDGITHDIDFGSSLCLDDGANYAIIGAPKYNDGSGAVYVYTKNINSENAETWTEIAKLTSTVSGLGLSPRFGYKVAMYDEYIIIAEPFVSYWKGAVHIYKINKINKINNQIELIKVLKPYESHYANTFGKSIGIDENYLIIYSKIDVNRSSVYIYDYVKNIELDYDEWKEIDVLLPYDNKDQSYSMFFGDNIGIQGNTMIVSAENDMDDYGSVYIFQDMTYITSDIQTTKIPTTKISTTGDACHVRVIMSIIVTIIFFVLY